MQAFDASIKETLESRLLSLEEHFEADVIFYYGEISPAVIRPFRDFILAMLSRYEQARDLTVTLLKKWLVEHKFRDWSQHESDPGKLGKRVTEGEKQFRAEEIAKALGDNKFWHSHGRMIGPGTLNKLRLKIDDYSADGKLRPLVRAYNDLLTEYIVRHEVRFFLHSRDFF